MPDDAERRAADGGWMLAIDTASEIAGLALFDGGELYLRQWPCVRAQTTQVLPAIHELLTQAGISLSDLTSVAVATGPGTFTGLRVGMSLAKGFAVGNSLPVIGVPTLQATAFPWTRIGAPIIAVVPAGRGRLVWQRFEGNDSQDGVGIEPRNSTPLELVESVRGRPVAAIVGDLTPPLRDALRELPIPIIAGPETPARVGSIAALGFERHLRDDHDDAAALEPQYVHGPRKATQVNKEPRP